MTPRAPSSDRLGSVRKIWASTIALVAGIACLVLVASCGSSKSAAPAVSSATSDAPAETAATGPPGATPGTLPGGTATIDQATLPVGTVLIDGTGFVLYAFLSDNGGASPCVDACASVWPPLTGIGIGVADGVPVTPGKFTLVKRPDGTSQVAVNGHPLYRYSGDSQQGQASGQGVGGVWFVVGPDGNPIKN